MEIEGQFPRSQYGAIAPTASGIISARTVIPLLLLKISFNITLPSMTKSPNYSSFPTENLYACCGPVGCGTVCPEDGGKRWKAPTTLQNVTDQNTTGPNIYPYL
jgi:hypothetical protein